MSGRAREIALRLSPHRPRRLVAWTTVVLALLAGVAMCFCTAWAPPAHGQSAPATQPQGQVYFTPDIVPILDRAGCSVVACHGDPANKTGLKLSLFGGKPEEDCAAVKGPDCKWVNQTDPAKSLLLLKVTGAQLHQGGAKIEAGSAPYQRLVKWIEQGARWADAKAPAMVRLMVSPEKQALKAGEAGAVTVKAVYADGSERDVTGDARFRSTDEVIITVAPGGKVTGTSYGEAAVVATYLRLNAMARVAVPQTLPKGFSELQASNKIDELVNAKLKALGIPPSEMCSDQEFVRRVYLELIGLLPTADEVKAFLDDKAPGGADKRAKLIDQLLDRPEFADYLTLKWGDVLRMKSEAPISMWPNAVQAYRQWVYGSILANKPFDQFATELITATGSNFRNPQANYYRAIPNHISTIESRGKLDLHGNMQVQAAATAQVFMGVRLSCAQCHAHPTEQWTQDDNLGMTAFFSQITFKNSKEWKEEIVCLKPEGKIKHPVTGAIVVPKALDGPTIEVAPGEDARAKFAQWLTDPKNPWFARNGANRIWFWIMGRGIIEAPDDIRLTNPPSNPELLDYLASEFVTRKFDTKAMFRLILNSQTYQRSSRPNEFNAKDAAQFSHYRVKRLGAEQLLDAISQVTGKPEALRNGIAQPHSLYSPGFRAVQIPDGSATNGFMGLFGRPARDTPAELDRLSQISERQILYLVNSSELKEKISGGTRLAGWLTNKDSDAKVIEELYLNALSRLPTDEETKAAKEYLGKDATKRAPAIEDLMWAVINTREFLYNH